MQNTRQKGSVKNAALQRLTSLGGGITNSPNFTTWTSRNVRKTKMSEKTHRIWSTMAVEIFFSAFKRIFGSSVMAKTMYNIIQEIALKIQRYNQLVDITQR